MDRILFVHNGALGDFLCAWPGMFSIISHYRSKSPETQILFSGRGFGMAWLEPLGVRKVGPELFMMLKECICPPSRRPGLKTARFSGFS